MKAVLTILFFGIVNIVQAQVLNKNTEGLYVLEKVDSTRLSKREMHEKSKAWIVRKLKSSDSNILLNDSTQITSTGNLLLKNRGKATCTCQNMRLNFKLTILFKDNKYKVIFDNMTESFNLVCPDGSGQMSSSYKEFPLEDIDKYFLSDKKVREIELEIQEKLIALETDLNNTLKNGAKLNQDW